jgi:hypothetical protein
VYVKDYLKMEELKDGYLYEVIARNAKYGIWNSDTQGFTISRIKFGSNFLFEEYHYDCPSFATAQPVKEIEKAPSGAGEKEVLEYLNKFEGDRAYMWPKRK